MSLGLLLDLAKTGEDQNKAWFHSFKYLLLALGYTVEWWHQILVWHPELVKDLTENL